MSIKTTITRPSNYDINRTNLSILQFQWQLKEIVDANKYLIRILLQFYLV